MNRFLPAFLFSTSALFAQTGQILVTVFTSTGAVVSNATVRVGARPFQGALANYHVSKKAGPDGKASFPNAPQGAYEVCAQLPGTTLLDSCDWQVRGDKTYLQAGATVNFKVVLKRGTQVVVSVADQKGLLAKEAFPGQKLSLMLSTKDSHVIPMAVTKGSTGHKFSALVPADTDLRLRIRSNDFQLSDSAGNHVDVKTPANFLPLHSNVAPAEGQAMPLTSSPILTFQLVGLQ